jgi:amino-acid N-acetyltransferase
MALFPVSEPPSSSSSLITPFVPPANELKASLRTRKAQLHDARAIYHLIDSFSHDGTLLHRPYAEICANIDTFTVVETTSRQFIGCAALHVYGQHLAELRSIVVRPNTKGHGAGGLLVQAVLDQAEARGIKCVCLFTRIPAFFEHFNFRFVKHQALPDKALKDCIHCPRRNNCDEIAMAIGELPDHSNMPWNSFIRPHHAELVSLQT